MKCEHEGCGETSDLERVQVALHGGDEVRVSPYLCAADRAAWLRELADEVEGVKECEYRPCMHCHIDPCDKCHGTGRVKA